MQKKLKSRVWAIIVCLCVVVSLGTDLMAGTVVGMITLDCPQQEYVIGLFYMCTITSPGVNSSGHDLHTTASHPWILNHHSSCTSLHLPDFPVWILGSQALLLGGGLCSLLLLLLLLVTFCVPASLALSIANGLALASFASAGFHVAGILKLSTGHNTHMNATVHLSNPFAECRVFLTDEPTYGLLLIVSIVALCMAGFTCFLSQALEGKLHHQQEYLNQMKSDYEKISKKDLAKLSQCKGKVVQSDVEGNTRPEAVFTTIMWKHTTGDVTLMPGEGIASVDAACI